MEVINITHVLRYFKNTGPFINVLLLDATKAFDKSCFSNLLINPNNRITKLGIGGKMYNECIKHGKVYTDELVAV